MFPPLMTLLLLSSTDIIHQMLWYIYYSTTTTLESLRSWFIRHNHERQPASKNAAISVKSRRPQCHKERAKMHEEPTWASKRISIDVLVPGERRIYIRPKHFSLLAVYHESNRRGPRASIQYICRERITVHGRCCCCGCRLVSSPPLFLSFIHNSS